jgi:hypothetical protein
VEGIGTKPLIAIKEVAILTIDPTRSILSFQRIVIVTLAHVTNLMVSADPSSIREAEKGSGADIDAGRDFRSTLRLFRQPQKNRVSVAGS